MRIVYVINNLGLGGAERVTVQLASSVASAGHHVEIVAMNGLRGTPHELLQSAGIHSRTLTECPMRRAL
jgi:hypothetical protein